ncbi:MAG: transporter [Cyclobacteriaceae bacterium]
MSQLFKVFLLISGITLSFTSYGQYNETIRSGRPGQSIGPFTVGKGIFQIQTGMDVFGYKTPVFKGDGFLNNTVLRYGIAERWEISALADYKVETWKSGVLETDLNGLAAFDIGGRYHVYSGEGLIPSIGFQLRFRLPVLSQDYEIDNVAPRFIIATNQKLSETFTLFTNWGGSWNGVNSTGTGFYTINLAFPICGKLGGFVENYGSLTDGDFDTRFDAGLSYLVNNDLQLDVLGGPGSNDGLKDYFVSVGLSWRTKR